MVIRFLLTSTTRFPKLFRMKRFWWAQGTLTLALLLPSTPAWAGAWTLPRNRWYTEYFYRYFGSKKEFNRESHSGRRAKTAHFSDIRNEVKFEYGLDDAVNLLASFPYQSSHYRDDNVDLLTTGVGDIFLRSKLRATSKPVVTSLQLSWKIPGGYDVNESPGLGDGQCDVESRLQVSRSWTFWPSKAPTSRRQSTVAASPEREPPRREGHQTREEAIREALVTSMLYERGQRLAQEGRMREAVTWFRAVLQNEPLNERARQWLARIMPDAEAALPPVALAGGSVAADRSATEEPAATRDAGVAFLNVEAAFTARNRGPANEVPLVVEAGLTPLKRLMLVGFIESVTSIRATHEQEEDFSKWGVRAILNLRGDGFASVFREDVGTTVNVEVGYNDVYAGRNTADAFEIFAKCGLSF